MLHDKLIVIIQPKNYFRSLLFFTMQIFYTDTKPLLNSYIFFFPFVHRLKCLLWETAFPPHSMFQWSINSSTSWWFRMNVAFIANAKNKYNSNRDYNFEMENISLLWTIFSRLLLGLLKPFKTPTPDHTKKAFDKTKRHYWDDTARCCLHKRQFSSQFVLHLLHNNELTLLQIFSAMHWQYAEWINF